MCEKVKKSRVEMKIFIIKDLWKGESSLCDFGSISMGHSESLIMPCCCVWLLSHVFLFFFTFWTPSHIQQWYYCVKNSRINFISFIFQQNITLFCAACCTHLIGVVCLLSHEQTKSLQVHCDTNIINQCEPSMLLDFNPE